MKGDQLCPTGCPTTAYLSLMEGFCPPGATGSRRMSELRDARTARVANIELGSKLRQPDLHALGQLVGRIHDQQAGAVESDLGVPRIQPHLADQRRRGHRA